MRRRSQHRRCSNHRRQAIDAKEDRRISDYAGHLKFNALTPTEKKVPLPVPRFTGAAIADIKVARTATRKRVTVERNILVKQGANVCKECGDVTTSCEGRSRVVESESRKQRHG